MSYADTKERKGGLSVKPGHEGLGHECCILLPVIWMLHTQNAGQNLLFHIFARFSQILMQKWTKIWQKSVFRPFPKCWLSQNCGVWQVKQVSSSNLDKAKNLLIFSTFFLIFGSKSCKKSKNKITESPKHSNTVRNIQHIVQG